MAVRSFSSLSTTNGDETYVRGNCQILMRYPEVRAKRASKDGSKHHPSRPAFGGHLRMTGVSNRSPDGAKRNPGAIDQHPPSLPDFAKARTALWLQPGYMCL